MKKIYLLATALAALVSCSSDEFVGENASPTSSNQPGAIQFTSDAPSITRATSAEDAEKLGYKFKVFGVKTVSSADQRVFATSTSGVTPYDVWYVDNSGNTTASNSSNWEYVGAAGSHGTSGQEVTLTTEQTIKYWDYSATEYKFQAWSDLNETSSKVDISAIDKNTMTITGATPTQLANLYISDLITITQGNTTDKSATNQYGGIVQFTFRKAATKVRLGIYETIPGYVVKDVVFHYTNSSDQTSSNAILDGNFIGSSSSSATFTVTYSGTPQKAVFSTTGGASNTSYFDFGTFASTTSIGTASNSPTWASGDYINVFPNTTNVGNMTLKVDYKLYNEVSNEIINVVGATATVPSAYMTWNPNYAYTYLFKISDNTNGSTGQSVVGLYPITLDAVVVSSVDGSQGTITSVTTPSITTYQAGSVVDGGIAYVAGTAIDITIQNGSTAVTPVTTGDGINLYVYQLTGKYDYNKTTEQNIGELTGLTASDLTVSDNVATIGAGKVESGKDLIIKYVNGETVAYKIVSVGTAEVGPTP